MDSDDELLVDIDFGPPSRRSLQPAHRDTLAAARQTQPSRATPPQQEPCGIVDLTSDCEDGAAIPYQPIDARPGSKRPAESDHGDGPCKRQMPPQPARLPANRLPARRVAAQDQLPNPAASAAPQERLPASRVPASRVAARDPLPDPAAAALPQERAPASRAAAKGTAAEQKALAAAERKRAAQEKNAAKEAEKQDRAHQRQLEKEAKAATKLAEKQQKQRQKEAIRQSRGKFADLEIKVVLSIELAMLPVGHKIMDGLMAKKYRFGIAALTMAPFATLKWTRSQVDAGSSQAALGPCVAPDAPEEDVPYVLTYMKAEEFVTEAEEGSLDALLARAAAAHPAATLCLLVDGLYHYVQTREQREFRQAGGVNALDATHTFTKRKTEAAVMSLVTRYSGVRHRIVHDKEEAAEHVVMLTRALANQPYRIQDSFQELASAGDGAASAALLAHDPLPPARQPLFKTLSHIPSLGPAGQHALANTFSSLGALMAEFLDPNKSEAEKLRMVSEVRQQPSRRVGPAAAQKLLRLLTTRDPATVIQG